MKQLKSIQLCADDFGLNREISLGILELVQKKRLSAVSCMVNLASFKLYAQELLALKQSLRIGLHFNLTQDRLLSGGTCFTLKELLLKSHMSCLNLSKIAEEFQAQCDAFIQEMGFLPQFIDGHQHIHQFPGIRALILDNYAQYLKDHTISIRSTYPSIGPSKYFFKSQVLAWTGGRALNRALNKQVIPHNPYFAGIYDFAPEVNYRSLFRQWLAKVPSHTLIMCHPAAGTDAQDSIAKSRVLEMHYFMSDAFLEDCQEFDSLIYLQAQKRDKIKL